jgi:hypothetical protein
MTTGNGAELVSDLATKRYHVAEVASALHPFLDSMSEKSQRPH